MAIDKLVDSTQLNNDLTSVANAIRTKSGSSSQLQFPSGFVSEISNISPSLDDTYFGNDPTVPQTGSTDSQNYEDIADAINTALARPNAVTLKSLSVTSNGTVTAPAGEAYDTVEVSVGGSATESDVNFYDYDGTIITSYTAADFANLTALPANPSHEGLTAQGWNWSLADAKTYVASYGMLDIGQMYTTTDGKTRVYVHLEAERLSPTLGLGVNGSVDIDWGDGTAHSTLTGTSLTTKVETTHTYAAAGDYVVTLTVTGSASIMGASQYSYLFYTSNNTRYAYLNAIQRVEIGANMSIGTTAFYNCYSLTSVSIPSGVTSIDSSAFYNCYSLHSVNIPNTVTSISTSAFNSCYSLHSVSTPNTVTSIESNAFNNCRSLSSANIPNTVTSIGSSTFSGCYSLTSVSIPSGVTTIGSSSFNTCYSLHSLNIPNMVTSIGSTAFGNCYSLTSVSIPSGVTTIGANTFSACYSLGFIKFEPATPPTVNNSSTWLYVSTDCIIYVPSGTKATYEGATNYPNPNTYTYVEY